MMAGVVTAQPVYAGANGLPIAMSVPIPAGSPLAQIDNSPRFDPGKGTEPDWPAAPGSGGSEDGGDEINAGNVVQFPAPENPRRGRKPKPPGADNARVSVEQVSKHTYAVRIRWFRDNGSEDGVVVNRLRDDIVKEIKRSKKRYEQFKNQTLSSWKSRSVRAGYPVGANTIGNV